MKLSIEKLKELLPDAELDRRGKYLLANCPKCGQREFTISTDENHLCGCNRKKKCGYRANIFGLAKILGKLSLLNIEGEVGKVDKLENKIAVIEKEYDLELPTIKMPLGWQRVYEDEYLSSRGFVEYDQYKVGRTLIHPKLKKNYVITAVEEGGEIKGYIGRHVWSKKQIDAENEKRKKAELPEIPRYKNSDTDFSKLIFGYDEIVDQVTHTVIAVEGIFDKWNVSRLLKLHTQDEIKCNATFKCHISIEQVLKWKIKGVKRLILFYDPDVIKEIKRVAGELQLWFDVLIAFNDAGDVDAGDIDAEGLSKVFSNLKTVSEFNSSKVTNILQ